MIVVRDGLQLCGDCLIVAVNGDTTFLDYSHKEEEAAKRLAEIEAGLARLGPHLVPSFDSETGEGCNEFSWAHCDCCHTHLGGSRHEFAILGPEVSDGQG